jgi:hypothetical protein
MNESSRGLKVTCGLLAAGLVLMTGLYLTRKSGGADDDAMARMNKIVSELEDCKTARRELKDRVAQLEADLKKAQEQANAPNVIPGGGAITASVHNGNGGGGGAPPMDQVSKIIRQNTGGLKMCYERALKRDSGLQMQDLQMTFRFYIHPTGATGEQSVGSNLHIDDQLKDCFKQAIGRIKFPAFTGEPLPFEWPVPFHPIGNK